jgi:L-ascorbate metabolism protein UlaG (beta-lactamase superfamily)
MPTKITWLGHGTFLVETAGKRVLIDPFLNDNPAAPMKADDVNPDAIIISHGHFDHVADAVAVAKRTGCVCVANFEICHWLAGQGVKHTHAQNTGGAHRHDFGTVKLTIAHHSSMLPDGSDGGSPNGVLLRTADGTIYHAADTALFGDMKLIGEEGIDLAIVPIGDNYTMGPEDSVRAVRLIDPKRVIPAHYNTWPPIAQDPHAWAQQVRAKTNAEPLILQPGDAVEL